MVKIAANVKEIPKAKRQKTLMKKALRKSNQLRFANDNSFMYMNELNKESKNIFTAINPNINKA